MNAFAELGGDWINREKHKICENNKLLEHTVMKHGLVVGNWHMKCKGVITKKHVLTKKNKVQ